MKVAFASDHAGFEYKQILIPELRTAGYEVLDLGTHSETPTDYPDQAEDVAKALLRKEADRGILICGSGVGVSVAVNKFKHIRAGVCHDNYSAHQSVEHDDANVLCMGQRIIGIELAREIVFTFLKAEFSNAPRHVRRIEKILAIENKNMKETIL
jgi:ribose 5-phosphate isomerase B